MGGVRCALTSHASVDLTTITRVLNELGADVVEGWPGDLQSMDGPPELDFLCAVFAPRSPHAFEDSDLTVAPPAVYFEIGLALGAKIPVLLIVAPDSHVPFTLSGLQYVTSTGDNAEALRLHLAAFINRFGRLLPNPIMVQRLVSKSVLDDAQRSLSRLDQQSTSHPESNAKRFEAIVARILSEGTGGSVSAPESRSGADIALWIEPIGLVVVELKIGRLNSTLLAAAEEQLSKYVIDARANFGLVVFHDVTGRIHKNQPSKPFIGRTSITDLIGALRVKSLDQVLYSERSAVVHGAWRE